MWNDWLTALQAEGKQARGVLWESPVVNIEDRFTPTVEHLKGIVASANDRHLNEHCTVFINGQPCLHMGNVQVGIGPGDSTHLTMQQGVPGEIGLEVEVLLT